MLGASLSALLCGEGRGGEGRARGRDLTSLFFPFSLCAGARKHMSPLHSGQEDKRARKRKKERKKKEEKKQGGIGIWRRRRSWRVFFSETQREVEKKRGGLLPGWPSEKSSDSFFGLLGLTNQHTKAKSKKKENPGVESEPLHTSSAELGCPRRGAFVPSTFVLFASL